MCMCVFVPACVRECVRAHTCVFTCVFVCCVHMCLCFCCVCGNDVRFFVLNGVDPVRKLFLMQFFCLGIEGARAASA